MKNKKKLKKALEYIEELKEQLTATERLAMQANNKVEELKKENKHLYKNWQIAESNLKHEIDYRESIFSSFKKNA